MSLYSQGLKILHKIEMLNTQILDVISTRNGLKRKMQSEGSTESKIITDDETDYTLFIAEKNHKIQVRIHSFLSEIQCAEEDILQHLKKFTDILFSTIGNILDVGTIKAHSDQLIQALRLQLEKVHNAEPLQIDKVHNELVKELISRNTTK